MERAASLGLKFRGRERGLGIGGNAIEASFVDQVSLSLPGVSFVERDIATIRLKDLQTSLGRPVDGILGYSFFRHFVVYINYAEHVTDLYDPRDHKYDGKGERLALQTDGQMLLVPAYVKPQRRDPIKGVFVVDTGGAHALIINKPFVERHGLLTSAQRANTVDIGGVGGSSRAVGGSIENLQLGRFDVVNVSTLFSQALSGVSVSKKFDGNIGNEVLKHFKRVIFDYSHRLLILEDQ
jgi:hypothetical protein